MPLTRCSRGIAGCFGSSIRQGSGARDASVVAARWKTISVLLARRAIESADVVVVVVDAAEGATDQDAAIAGEADRLGRGIIIVANKWDLTKENGPEFVKGFDEELRRQLKFLDYATILHISALTGERTPKLLEAIDKVAESRQRASRRPSSISSSSALRLSIRPRARARGTSAFSMRRRRASRRRPSSFSRTSPRPSTSRISGISRIGCARSSASRELPSGSTCARGGRKERPEKS